MVAIVDELKKIIAFVFRMKGIQQMKQKAFMDSLSFDLHWYTPDEAKKLMALCLESNYLQLKDGFLSPNFDIVSIDIPIVYKPGPEVLSLHAREETSSSEEKEDFFMSLVSKIEKASSLTRIQLMSKINAVQRDMDIDIEVAALLIASDYDIDVKSLESRVSKEILKKYDVIPGD